MHILSYLSSPKLANRRYTACDRQVPETRGERADVLLQLFSPFIASQRIMACEFHNPYAEVECENGLRMVFHEVRR